MRAYRVEFDCSFNKFFSYEHMRKKYMDEISKQTNLDKEALESFKPAEEPILVVHEIPEDPEPCGVGYCLEEECPVDNICISERVPLEYVLSDFEGETHLPVFRIGHYKGTTIIERSNLSNKPFRCWYEVFAIGPEEKTIIDAIKKQAHNKPLSKEEAVDIFRKQECILTDDNI